MTTALDDKLVVAISSRALFDLEEENRLFESGDPEGYMRVQLQRLDTPARPGIAHAMVRKLLRFNELSHDEFFCTEEAALAGVTFTNTSLTEPLVALRYFGPEVNPDAPAMGAHRSC